MLYLSLLRGGHYEKVLTTDCIVIVLKFLDERPIFSGTVPRQERGSFVCKHRQTEEAKAIVHIFLLNKLF